MANPLSKFKLNGTKLSDKQSNSMKLLGLLRGTPSGHLLDRKQISETLKISLQDSAFTRLPEELRYKLPDRRVVYGNAKTIRSLRKEFAQ
jgi:hypothetical protein